MTSSNMPTGSPLLNLPPELRNMIYEHYFALAASDPETKRGMTIRITPVEQERKSSPLVHRQHKGKYTSPFAFLQVCKQIYYEARGIGYDNVIARIDRMQPAVPVRKPAWRLMTFEYFDSDIKKRLDQHAARLRDVRTLEFESTLTLIQTFDSVKTTLKRVRNNTFMTVDRRLLDRYASGMVNLRNELQTLKSAHEAMPNIKTIRVVRCYGDKVGAEFGAAMIQSLTDIFTLCGCYSSAAEDMAQQMMQQFPGLQEIILCGVRQEQVFAVQYLGALQFVSASETKDPEVGSASGASGNEGNPSDDRSSGSNSTPGLFITESEADFLIDEVSFAFFG